MGGERHAVEGRRSARGKGDRGGNPGPCPGEPAAQPDDPLRAGGRKEYRRETAIRPARETRGPGGAGRRIGGHGPIGRKGRTKMRTSALPGSRKAVWIALAGLAGLWMGGGATPPPRQ